MENLTLEERKIASLIQRDISLKSTPFEEIGSACGLTTSRLIHVFKTFLKKGIMRKFGAVLRHQKVGYGENAMVIWSVPADQTEKAGKVLASFSFISHCYERKPAFKGKYNLFTMLHTRDNDATSLIKTMAESINTNNYLVLESLQEYKKISPEYF